MVHKREIIVAAYPYFKAVLGATLVVAPGLPVLAKLITPIADFLMAFTKDAGLLKSNLTKVQQIELENIISTTLKETYKKYPDININASEDIKNELKKYVSNNTLGKAISPDTSNKIIQFFNQTDNFNDKKLDKFAKTYTEIFEQKIVKSSLANHFNLAKIKELQTQIDNLITRVETLENNPFSNISKNLTHKAPCWMAPIFGDLRNEFINELYQKLCKKQDNNYKLHICLTGMGGIGKTEILNNVFNHFKDKKNGFFDHVALLTYEGSMDDSLMQIDYPWKDKNADSVFRYMHRLCEEKSVLILIDDKRFWQTEKKQTFAQDESFSKLSALNATMLFTSRTLDENLKKSFIPLRVEPLSASVCTEIFKDLRYGDKKHFLSDFDEKVLLDVVENRAGRNPLIVMRLGAMAQTRLWSVTELDEKLKEQHFDIRKGFNDETLQEEINKLYRFKDVETGVEQSLLEAFALFPNLQLDQKTCIKWLREDANVDKDDCQLTLTHLSNFTWLMLHENKQEGTESTVYSYSMHQLVKTAVTTQPIIAIDKHRKLLEHLTNAVSWGHAETFQKAQQYVSYATSLIEYFSEKHVNDVDLASLMLWLGRYYNDIADYSKALEWYMKDLAITEKVLGKDHPSTATTYNNIALVYSDQGKYEQALEMYFKSYRILKRKSGEMHPNTVIVRDNMKKTFVYAGFAEPFVAWLEKKCNQAFI
jgi:tetratricopeptide (TPR) repeat protein